MPNYTPGLDWKLDSSGDLIVPVEFTDQGDAIAQAIQIRVLMVRGEYKFNLDTGVPYMANDTVSEAEAILGQKFDARKARLAFRDAILSVPEEIGYAGIYELVDLVVDFAGATRELNVAWRVQSDFGIITGSTS